MAKAGGPKSVKLDEAQASARSCAGRPDFFPCDGGQSVCATHSHGKCFKLHWCCHLGWCHCKYVYQPMTSVCQLPSTPVPSNPSDHNPSFNLSVSLAERFLRTAPSLVAPPNQPSPKFCIIAELFMDDYVVKRINGKMCYVQRLPITPPPKIQATPTTSPSMLSSSPGFHPSPKPHPTPKHQSQPQRSNQKPPQTTKAHPPAVDQKLNEQKPNPCSSPSSSEDSGINAVGGAYTESYDEEDEEDDEEEEDEEDDEEEEEMSSDVESSHSSLWEQEFSLLAPSRSLVEIIEKMETTV